MSRSPSFAQSRVPSAFAQTAPAGQVLVAPGVVGVEPAWRQANDLTAAYPAGWSGAAAAVAALASSARIASCADWSNQDYGGKINMLLAIFPSASPDQARAAMAAIDSYCRPRTTVVQPLFPARYSMPAGEASLSGTPGSATSGLGYALVAVVAFGALYLMVRSTEDEEKERHARVVAARRGR